MLSERQKLRLILTAAISAISVDGVMLLGGLIMRCPILNILGRLLLTVGFRVWGWAPALGLGVIAITCTVRWKPGSRKLRLFVLFVSIIAVFLSLLWACVSYIAITFKP